jgi:hypothetical protein
MTFKNIKDIISKALHGKLNTTQEKTDGQNLLVTWKDGELRAARNPGHIKNYGEKALNLDGLTSMFAGRGEIEKAFVYAMNDMQEALSNLPKDKLESYFENGKKFLSIEVIYPSTTNVIPYDFAMLVPHGLLEYDEKGNAIGEDKESAKELFKTIQTVNSDVQKNFKLRMPNDVKIVIKDADKQEKQIISDLDKLMKQYGLTDEDNLYEYRKAYWKKEIQKKTKEFGYKVPENVLNGLVDRWGADKKTEYTVGKIKKDIDNEEFKNWVLSLDANKDMYKQAISGVETILLKLGVQMLKNMDQFLATDPSKAKEKLRKDLQDKIKEIESSGTEEAKEKLNMEMDRLSKIGGMEAILPAEGITFQYNGKLYKLTGGFAPLNQIMNIGRYTKK